MARVARTHKKTVKPNFEEAEMPDPFEEAPRGLSTTEGTLAHQEEERAEVSHEAEDVDSKVLYNDDLGSEVP